MKLKEINVRSLLAIFVVAFGMVSIVFVDLEDMVLGGILSFIGIPLGYFFVSSKSSEAKDKTISDMTKNSFADDIGGGGQQNPKNKPTD